MKYFSSRNNLNNLTSKNLVARLNYLVLHFGKMGYFYENLRINWWQSAFEFANTKAQIEIGFDPFPSVAESITKDENIFDLIEFLFNYISKPGAVVTITSDTGLSYEDFESYSKVDGQNELISIVNHFSK